jgi:hypothetical protein
MTRKTLSAEVKRLQQQHWQLQQQVELLQRSRRALQLKHALAVKWCEGLDYVNQQLSTHAPQLQVHIGDDVQLVLQQVACTEEWPSLEQLLQPDSSTIAPTTDPLALLRHFMPPTAQLQPEDATAVGHAGLFKHTAMTLAIKLQQLQALPTGQRQPLLQDISTIWHRLVLVEVQAGGLLV